MLDLATAVKELVENSIDAGAKKVDVRLAEYGMDKIEVSDDGEGIAPANYESLALRHHTSKLSSFQDLENMETFGFRGEALSALAALGVLSITTRQAGQDVATTLEFSRGGELLKRAPAARDVGTTVTVTKIFSPLPVRYQEFKRNIKKEFSRLHDVLAGYSLVARDVRLTVTNVAKKGGRQGVIKTLGNGSLKDTVSSVFGIRQLNTLQELHAHSEETGIVLEGFVSKLGCGRSSCDRQLFSINSRPVDMAKLSRTCNEVWRQFTSHQYPVVIINITMSRKHCDINVNPDKRQMLLHTETELRELLRDALTEAYAPPALSQSQNSGKSGVTPSAASWLVPVEPTSIRAGGETGTAASLHPEVGITAAGQNESDGDTAEAALRLEGADGDHSGDPAHLAKSAASLGESTVSSGATDTDHQSPARRQLRNDDASEPAAEFRPLPTPSAAMTSPVQAAAAASSPVTTDPMGSLAAFSSTGGAPRQWVGNRPRAAAKTTATEADHNQSARAASTDSSRPRRGQKRPAADAAQGEITAFFNRATFAQYSHASRGSAGDQQTPDAGETEDGCDPAEQDERDEQEMSDEDVTRPQLDREQLQPRVKRARGDNHTVEDCSQSVPTRGTNRSAQGGIDDCGLTVVNPAAKDSASESLGAADVLVDVDLASVLDASTRRASVDGPQDVSCAGQSAKDRVSRFLHSNLAQDIRARRSSAAAADDKATHELARSLAKEDFEQMQVLGQFNRGFIIAKLRNDLFIVDQHACDEKYNFETMQANTKLHTQRMVNSMPLEVRSMTIHNQCDRRSYTSSCLTLSIHFQVNVAGELVVLDHLEIMAANGFDFDVDETAPAGALSVGLEKPGVMGGGHSLANCVTP